MTPKSGAEPAPIRIVADHREARSGAVAALQAMAGVELSFDHLSTGDYLVDARMLFERKTLTDLAESIKDGRLFRQAWELANLAGSLRGALILEGTSADLAQSGMHREAIQGALITVSLFFGVPVLRAMTAEESARLMIYAARQAQAYATGALPRPGKRPKGKRKTQLAILQGLPGVGPERAAQLLGAFGNVQAVLAASAAQLEHVPGVGSRTAQAIRWAVGETEATYHAAENDPAL